MKDDICTDSCFDIGTDYGCLIMRTEISQTKEKKKRKRVVSGRRELVSTPVLGEDLNQQVLRDLAARHTQVPRSKACRDDTHQTALREGPAHQACSGLEARTQGEERGVE